MYHNYLTEKYESECAEPGNKERGLGDRWFIKMGFAGFNSTANNGTGYATKRAAELACMRYQGYKGKGN